MILIAHSIIETRKDPLSDSYGRHVLLLDKRSAAIVREKVEMMAFAHKVVFTKEVDKSFTIDVYAFTDNEAIVFNFVGPTLSNKEKKRARLYKRAQAAKNRSLADIQANTVVVSARKFEAFYEAHRTEE